ncbi:MAG TPA: lysophospholipid acyltransferase family protein [Planctomycetaceae bacterium]|nr:lysophospholipid acyltransferase family protein [Planctomycetaceae bacterium]
MSWRAWRYRAEYVAFRLLLCVWQCLSPRQCVRLAEGLAWFIHHCLPRRLTRYEVARGNLQQALGPKATEAEIDAAIHGMWVHLFRLLAEIAHVSRKLHHHSLLDVIDFRNKSVVVDALLSGRPVLLLSGHFGNWEIAISVFGHFGFPMGVVARDLENPLLDCWFRRFRQSTGHHLIGKKDFDQMTGLLEQGACFALLGDQDAGKGGLFVDFFDKPASTPKTIALLALEYDALICVGYARRLNEPADWVRYELGCEDIIDPREISADDPIREITQRYTSALERVVRRSPEQYFWLHKRWKSQPGDRAARRKQRAAARKAG